MFKDSPLKFRSTASSYNSVNNIKQPTLTSTIGQMKLSSRSIRTSSFSSMRNTQAKLNNFKEELNYIH